MLVWEWDYLDICLKSTALGLPAQPEVPAAPADHLARSWWSARQNDLRGFGVCKGKKLVDWWFVFSISLSTGNYRFWRTLGWWRKGNMKRTALSLATCPTLCELLSLLLPWQQHAWTKKKIWGFPTCFKDYIFWPMKFVANNHTTSTTVHHI